MTVDLDKLEELARAATPGPWEARNVGDVRVHRTVAHRVGLSVRDHVTVRGQLQEAYAAEQQAVADAAFIAAANPAAVLELVERVRAAEADAHRIVTESQTGWATAYRNTETLRAIVRDLAAVPSRTFIEQGPTGNPACVMCGWGRDGSNEGRDHAESCPWRRAVEGTKP